MTQQETRDLLSQLIKAKHEEDAKLVASVINQDYLKTKDPFVSALAGACYSVTNPLAHMSNGVFSILLVDIYNDNLLTSNDISINKMIKRILALNTKHPYYNLVQEFVGLAHGVNYTNHLETLNQEIKESNITLALSTEKNFITFNDNTTTISDGTGVAYTTSTNTSTNITPF